jgi:hypothetical protein
MKTAALLASLCVSFTPLVAATSVQRGDTVADVRAALGAPRGEVSKGDKLVLYYESGEVEFNQGTAVRVALRTPEEQAEQESRAARIREEREARRQEMAIEGVALRDRTLANEEFRATSLSYQVGFWENFSRSYPGVSVSEPLTLARVRLREELSRQRREDEQAARVAELEARVAELTAPQEYYPLYTSSPYYSYGYWRDSYYPPSLGPIRYNFGNTSAAPYETPHGSPYTTPSTFPGSSYPPTSAQANYRPGIAGAAAIRSDIRAAQRDAHRPHGVYRTGERGRY